MSGLAPLAERPSRPRSLVVITFALIAGSLLAASAYIAFVPSTPANKARLPDQLLAQAYELEPGEVVRFFPPPYPQARYRYVDFINPNIPPEYSGTIYFHAIPAGYARAMDSGYGTLRQVIEFGGMLTPVNWDIPPNLASTQILGDWAFRAEATPDQRMAAIQDILRQVLHRPIIIEKRPMLRPTVVMSGHYQFNSLGKGRCPSEIQLFTNTLDPQEGAGGGAGTRANLIQRIEEITSCRLIDQSTDWPASVQWSNNNDALDLASDPPKISSFLSNLTRQTSLHFQQTTRQIDVYCVREEGPLSATRP